MTPPPSTSSESSPSTLRGDGPTPGPAVRGGVSIRASIAVALLCGVVAMTSRDAPVWAELRRGPADPIELIGSVVIGALLSLLGVGAIALAWHRLVVAQRPEPTSPRATLLRALPFGAVAFGAISLFAITQTALDGGSSHFGFFGDLLGQDRALGAILDDRDGMRAGDDRRPGDESGYVEEDDSPVDDIFLILLFCAGAYAMLRRRRRTVARRRASFRIHGGSSLPRATEAAALRETVIDTIDEMLRDPDPRTAIIGAYARLLKGLDQRQAGRLKHEAPLEHLGRVLTRLHVRPEPLRRLTKLFEIARFSTHDLTGDHRAQALAALREAAADLSGSDSPVPT